MSGKERLAKEMSRSMKIKPGKESLPKEWIIEAYVGEYASGKSEVAVNRALKLYEAGRRPVTLVDFDLVEPFYTLRPIKKELEGKGIKVLAWETIKTMGLGEAGNLLKPDIRWALQREGDIIIDVGYGVGGLAKLELLEDPASSGGIDINEDDDKCGGNGKRNNNGDAGIVAKGELKIYAVINIARPLTGSVEAIVEYVRSLGPQVQGLINNSHWGDETEVRIINRGAEIVTEAAEILGLPVIWTAADNKFRGQIGDFDRYGHPVFYLERYMQRAFW